MWWQLWELPWHSPLHEDYRSSHPAPHETSLSPRPSAFLKMCPSESLAFKEQPSHRCFPRDGMKRPCIPLNGMPQAHRSLALQPGRTCLQAAGEPMVSSCCQRTAKDLTNIRLSIPGMQTALEEVRLTGGHRMPAEPDKFAQHLAGAKEEPRKISTSIQGCKEHPLLLFSSPDVSVTGSALCKVLTSWFSLWEGVGDLWNVNEQMAMTFAMNASYHRGMRSVPAPS